MENMGDVTYDNPVYEFDGDDLDSPAERLVHLPAPLVSSGPKNENVSCFTACSPQVTAEKGTFFRF
jgi:hypothetical protein